MHGLSPPVAPDAVTVTGDRRFWWVPLPWWTLRATALGVVIMLIVGFSGQGRELALTAGVGLPLAGVACGLGHCLIWFAFPCRTRYTVRDGQLLALRGRRVLVAWECVDITDVVVAKGVGMRWRDTLFSAWYPYMGGSMPPSTVQIRPRGRWDQRAGNHRLPTIMIWGPDHAQHATEQFRIALARERAGMAGSEEPADE